MQLDVRDFIMNLQVTTLDFLMKTTQLKSSDNEIVSEIIWLPEIIWVRTLSGAQEHFLRV